MTVYTENLSARLLEHRQIEFYDGENVIFTMASPYMYDAAGELSDKITVKKCWIEGSNAYEENS